MLRVRSERRRLRHVEVLQRQKEEEESDGGGRSREATDREPGDEVFSPSSKAKSPLAAATSSLDSRRSGTAHTQVSGEVNT